MFKIRSIMQCNPRSSGDPRRNGYVDIRSQEFENPVNFCFTDLQFDIVHCCDCDEVVALKCSWCKKHLCLHHFFEEYHYCEDYIE